MTGAVADVALAVVLAALLAGLWRPLGPLWRPPPPLSEHDREARQLAAWQASVDAARARWQPPVTPPPPDYPPWESGPRLCGLYEAPVTWLAVPARHAQEAALLALTGSDRSRSEAAA